MKTAFISYLLKAVFFLFVFTPFFIACKQKEFNRPNIILIMADDLGFGDIGCFGNEEIKTPALDSLASEGMIFTDFHSNGAVCTPTRAALLTGRYQQRSGLEGVIYAKGDTRQTGLDVKEFTIADYLKDIKYVTGIAGKWHLGYRIEYNPLYQGFDFFRGFVSGNVDFHSHVDGAGIPDWWHNLEKTKEEGYSTDLITGHALTFIEENKDVPFFLYVAHAAPHYPFQGRNDRANRFPGRKFTAHGSRKDKKGAYKEMIEVMDEGIGKILTKLEELKLEKNTLILFCSDNGGLNEVANNGSLRGSKGSLWEGGHRVPAIAWWPGMIDAGEVSNQTVLSMDFFPTIVNLTKIKEGASYDLDGTDISGLLFNDEELPERTVFWKYRDNYVARQDNWKLIINKDSTFLFDLEEDLFENQNLIDSYPYKVEQLKLELDSWYKDVKAKAKQKTI